jgi:hypothetical protein
MSFEFQSQDPRGGHPALNSKTAGLDSKAPWWLLAAAVGVAISAASAGWDHHRRHTVEALAQPTAVGDLSWWKMSAAPKGDIRFQDAALRPASGEVESFPDIGMRVVGQSEDGQFRLYVPEERSNGVEETGGPSWFLKVGPNRFLRFTR